MNIRSLVILFVTFLIITKSYSQTSSDHYTLNDIENVIMHKFGYDLHKTEYKLLYVIDGIPYYEKDIIQFLNKHDKNYIKSIVAYKPKIHSGRSWSYDFIIILLTNNQTNKRKREILKTVRQIYQNENELPLLTIDNVLISESNSNVVLKK